MEWKKSLLVGVGWGLGTALGLAILFGGFLWYESRPSPPKPPKPWDTRAIRAEYDYASTEGDNNNIVIYYTLENTTSFDYRVEDGHDVTMNATLERENSLSPFSDFEKIDYPIFIPAKKRVRFGIHIKYPYSIRQKVDANVEERRKYREALEKYMADEMYNLDGFDLLDHTNRYEILFPAGWKLPNKQ